MSQGPQPTQPAGYTLALETSSLWGSAALGRAGTLLAEQSLERPRKHASDLLPVIDRLCRDADIEPAELREVYVSIGPGSFTGLRVGVTVARMLALAHGARVVAVPTLTVIAQNALEADDPPERVVVITDAKRRHVYTATFERQREGHIKRQVDGHTERQGDSYAESQADGYTALTEPTEQDPAQLFAAEPPTCAILGSGATEHREAVESSGLRVLPDSLSRPHARTVFALGTSLAQQGNYTAARELVPHYVRRVEAEERWEERYGSPG